MVFEHHWTIKSIYPHAGFGRTSTIQLSGEESKLTVQIHLKKYWIVNLKRSLTYIKPEVSFCIVYAERFCTSKRLIPIYCPNIWWLGRNVTSAFRFLTEVFDLSKSAYWKKFDSYQQDSGISNFFLVIVSSSCILNHSEFVQSEWDSIPQQKWVVWILSITLKRTFIFLIPFSIFCEMLSLLQ